MPDMSRNDTKKGTSPNGMEGGAIKMRYCPEFEILKDKGDMYETDYEKNILIPLENATPEVREAIEILNRKMNFNE